MNRALWSKSIHDGRWLWLSCALMLYAFGWVYVWITSQVDMSQFQAILDSLPDAWKRLSPVPIEQVASYGARIAFTYEEPTIYLAIALWSVARSSDCVSGEIGRGTMEMLLAQPTSRLQVILIPTIVTVVGAALLALVAWSGTLTGIATLSVDVSSPQSVTVPILEWEIALPGTAAEPERVPMRQLVNARAFAPAAVNLFALGFCLAGMGTFFSSWDRYRWRTIGIVVALIVVQMMIEVVALAVEPWSWLKWFTFLSAYEPVRIIIQSLGDANYAWSWLQYDDHGRWASLGPLGYDAVLLGLGTLGFVAGGIIFSRRDFPAPL